MNIHSGGSDPVILQGQGQRGLVHQAAPGGVDQEGARPHLLDGVLVNQMVVVLVEGAVQGDAVRLEQEVLQGVDPLQAQGLLNAVRQVGVVEYHIEPKCLGSQGNGRTDTAWNIHRIYNQCQRENEIQWRVASVLREKWEIKQEQS